jgi:UbiD family decarboxylase
MAYHDLREYVATLEKHGKLKRVTKEVDKDWEIAGCMPPTFQEDCAAKSSGASI